jgi:quercetin dioxygenase-like cupin family protein
MFVSQIRTYHHMENSNKAITLDAQGGENLSVVGDTYRILVSGKQTNGTFAVIDMLIPPGGGPGPHAHAAFQESFYVIDGEIEVKTKGQSYTAKKGSFVSIPLGGLPHCFKNESGEVAHILCTVVPSGLEAFFEEVGKPVAAGTFLPPPELDEESLKKLLAIAESYGQILFPPDYLD